jgi:O-succinylbenzoic acid--CoA ligase
MGRKVQLLPVPTGDAVLALLPRLCRAVGGEGPVLLPVPADDPERSPAATLLAGSVELRADEDDDTDPTALVVTTSGSTGPPKGALLAVSALHASARATRQRLSEPAEPARPTDPGGDSHRDQWLLALPATHIAGLQVLLRAVAADTVPTVLDTGLPFTPERFCAAVDRIPAGHRFTSLVPTQLVRLLADPDSTQALTTFDAVLLGGASAPVALLEQAAAAGATIVTTYGMTETCGGCVYGGRPLDGVTATLEDDGSAGGDGAGESRGAAVRGRVVLAGPVIARGYLGMPGHPAFTRRHGQRVFRTQDVGAWQDGRLHVIGRIDDVIVTGGVKVDPGVVEAILAGVRGVADVLVTAVPDAEWGQLLVALVVPDGSHGPELDELRDAAGATLDRRAAPRRLVLVDQLPYRGIGKPDRVAARELATRALSASTSGSHNPTGRP